MVEQMVFESEVTRRRRFRSAGDMLLRLINMIRRYRTKVQDQPCSTPSATSTSNAETASFSPESATERFRLHRGLLAAQAGIALLYLGPITLFSASPWKPVSRWEPWPVIVICSVALLLGSAGVAVLSVAAEQGTEEEASVEEGNGLAPRDTMIRCDARHALWGWLRRRDHALCWIILTWSSLIQV